MADIKFWKEGPFSVTLQKNPPLLLIVNTGPKSLYYRGTWEVHPGECWRSATPQIINSIMRNQSGFTVEETKPKNITPKDMIDKPEAPKKRYIKLT